MPPQEVRKKHRQGFGSSAHWRRGWTLLLKGQSNLSLLFFVSWGLFKEKKAVREIKNKGV